MSQADQTEERPAVPAQLAVGAPHRRRRRRAGGAGRGAPAAGRGAHGRVGNLTWHAPRVGWETFGAQSGFGVLLAGNTNAASPALMEAAYAQGRFILTAMALDKPEGAGRRSRCVQPSRSSSNLYEYTRDVCRRQARPVNVTPSQGATGFGGAFTLVVLPDTQYYSSVVPGHLPAQTSWIVANAQRLHIPYVFHLGDIVDQNTPLEWQRAARRCGCSRAWCPTRWSAGQPRPGPVGQRDDARHADQPVLLLRDDRRPGRRSAARSRSASWRTPTTCSRPAGATTS